MMADNESSGSMQKALVPLSEALALLDLGSQHIAAAFVAQALSVLESKQSTP